MNKLVTFLVVFVLASSLHAQSVTVKSQSEKVKGESAEGFGTELDGKKEGVSASWIKFLKEIGKLKQSGDPMTITEPSFNGLSFSKGIVYATVNSKGEKTSVWLGIVPGEWESNDVKRTKNELEKAVHQFGVKFYKDRIQVQVDEAQQAFDAVEKQKQRLTNQTKDLTIQQANNEQEKIELDKSVEINRLESLSIKEKLAKNVKAQDSLSAAGIQIQKVKQSHVDRQKQVK